MSIPISQNKKKVQITIHGANITLRANVAISEDVLAVLNEGSYHIDLT